MHMVGDAEDAYIWSVMRRMHTYGLFYGCMHMVGDAEDACIWSVVWRMHACSWCLVGKEDACIWSVPR